MIDALKQLFALTDKLTWPRLLLLISTGGAVIGGSYLWRHQDTAIPALVGNSAALMALGVAVSCLAIGLIGSAMMARADRKGDLLERYLRDEVRCLADKVDSAQATLAEQALTIGDLARREGQCQQQLSQHRRRLERAEKALRDYGQIPPAGSDWGAL